MLLAVSLSASWQIAYGRHLADYSRYLPRAPSPARTFAEVFCGMAIGAQVSMMFGVLAAALAGDCFAGHEDALGGVDVSWIVGIVVPGLLYYVASGGALASVPDRPILSDSSRDAD